MSLLKLLNSRTKLCLVVLALLSLVFVPAWSRGSKAKKLAKLRADLIDTWQIYDPSGDELIKIDIRGVEARPFGYAFYFVQDPEPKHNKVDNASERVKQLRDDLTLNKLDRLL